MVVPFYLLLIAGHVGFFDVLYFHHYRFKLYARVESQREVLLHALRHLIYGAQFLIISNLRFRGSALMLLVLLYLADACVAWLDAWEETASRRSLGGLARGEYLMHIVLSFLIGAYLLSVFQATWPDRLLPTAILVAPPPVPIVFRLLMNAMGLGALAFSARDLTRWVRFRRKRFRTTQMAA